MYRNYFLLNIRKCQARFGKIVLKVTEGKGNFILIMF